MSCRLQCCCRVLVALQLLPQTLNDIRKHPLLHAQQAQISVGLQPFRKKIPPLVPDFDAVVLAVLQDKSQVPVSVPGKVQTDLRLVSVELQPLLIPKSRKLASASWSCSCFSKSRGQGLAASRIMNHVKTSRVGPPPRVQLPPGTLPVRAIALCLGGR